MIYSIDYSKSAQKEIAKWKKSNPALFDKLRKILLTSIGYYILKHK